MIDKKIIGPLINKTEAFVLADYYNKIDKFDYLKISQIMTELTKAHYSQKYQSFLENIFYIIYQFLLSLNKKFYIL